MNPMLKDPDRPLGSQKSRRNLFLRDFEEAKVIVRQRSRGWCEFDCDRYAVVFHHKAGRKVPGANHPDRIVHLCDGHHRWAHANPGEAYEAGLMERRT